MKVTLIYYQYPLYDRGSYIQEQVDAVAALVEGVLLGATKYPAGAKFERPATLTMAWVPRFKIPFLTDLLFDGLVFLKLLFSQKFWQSDLIHVVCARGILAGIMLKFVSRKPLVCTVEIINPPTKSKQDAFFYSLQKWLFTRKSIDKIICWSHFHYEKYLKSWGIPKNKVVFISCGIDFNLFDYKTTGREIRAKYAIAPLDKLLVFAKPMYEYNRLSAELLLTAVSSLRRPDLKILCGGGQQKALLQDYAKKIKFENSLFFMDPVPLSEIPKYLAAADLIVLPFTYEATTARSFLESLAMKKPVIVTKMGEIQNLVENNDQVLMVDPEVGAVAAAILVVLKDREFSDKIAETGYKWVRSNYSIEHIATQTVSVYKNLVR